MATSRATGPPPSIPAAKCYLRFMFDDDGHIWHSSGECLGVNGDKLKKGKCATAEWLVSG